MGQQEVIKLLEKNQWMTANEIATELGREKSNSVRQSLHQMHKYGEVSCRTKKKGPYRVSFEWRICK